MAKRKRRNSKRNFKIPLATVAGLMGTLSVKGAAGASILDSIMAGKIDDVMYNMREKLAGVDANGKFHLDWVAQGWGPFIVGILISKFVGGSPLNLNQKLRQIPFIKI